MDPFREEAARLIAKGADPRRAGQAAAEFFGLPRAVGVRQAFGVGVALGTAVMMALAGATAWTFDLRPAGNAVAVTATSTSDATAHSRHANIDVPTPAAQIEAALSPVPVEQRPAVLADLVKVTVMLRDPIALTVVRAIRDLSEQDRVTLAQSTRLKAVLAWMANLKADQQTALLATDFRPVLGDPDRLALLQVLPQLDPLSAQVLANFKYATFTQRQTLMAVLTLIANDDGHFDRLIAAFSNAAPSLVKLLDGRLIDCQFSNRGACR